MKSTGNVFFAFKIQYENFFFYGNDFFFIIWYYMDYAGVINSEDQTLIWVSRG